MDAFLQSSIKRVGTNIQPQARIVINNVLTFLTELKENPDQLKSINFNKARELTAKICGVSLKTVGNIKRECTNEGPTCPRESIYQPRPVRGLDDFDKSVIKRIVSSFFSKGEYPTIKKVLEKSKETIKELKCSHNSMRNILVDLGYKYKTSTDGRPQLMERSDIVCARLKFLRKLDELRNSNDNRPRIYLGEMWVNQNYTRKRVWVCDDGEGGLNNKIGKGGRLIVCHAGCSSKGFLPDTKWIFRAIKSRNEDYHSEMDPKSFTEWFTRLLSSLKEPSVLIMDNARYHSQQVNRAPTWATDKSEIQDWLRQKNIPFLESELKVELLQKVKRHCPDKLYHLDQLAHERGHEVVRLPPYHCQYNPIELIWAQVKCEVIKDNSTFNIDDIEQLIHTAIANISVEDWQKCVQHAETLQHEDFQKAHLCDRLVISVGDDTETESDSDVD